MSTPGPMPILSTSAAAPHATLQQVPEDLQSVGYDRERAASLLEHAMAYLIVGRFKHPRADKDANRQAVRILCDARDVLDYFSY